MQMVNFDMIIEDLAYFCAISNYTASIIFGLQTSTFDTFACQYMFFISCGNSKVTRNNNNLISKNGSSHAIKHILVLTMENKDKRV